MACHVNMHVSQAAMSGLEAYHVNIHVSQAVVSGLSCEHACKPAYCEWLVM